MPDWVELVRSRLSSLNLSPEREAEIVDELAQHLEDRWREAISGGSDPEEATETALAGLRDEDMLARYMAPLRQARRPPAIAPGAAGTKGHWLVDLRQDLRYALRMMAARPGFTAVAVLSLALGLGADTAIFGLWNGVLHASLPGVRDPAGLVILSNPDEAGSWTGRTTGVRSWLTYGEFEQLRDDAGAFSALMASQSGLDTWQVRFDGDAAEEAKGRLVSGGFFEVLGVRPAMGRFFTQTGGLKEAEADAPEAVISYPYWQRRFGGRADVLGRRLTIRNTVVSIVGVAPQGFIGETSGQRPDLWLPLRLQPGVMPGRDRLHDVPPEKSMWLHVFGRLKPGVTAAQAQAQANAVFQAGLESFYGGMASGERRREFLDQRLQVRPAARGVSRARREFSQSLTALLAAVGVLLLIACANLANLLLARGAARRTEMAVRLSLGASRGRLIRQLVTESLALAAIGGAGAIGVAYFIHGALAAMMAKSNESFAMGFTLDPLVVAFLGGATAAAALLFGVLPAWQITRTDAGAALQDQSRGAIGSLGQLRSGRVLVSLQLALSLPLLVGAGLLARTVFNLQRADLGFPAERLLLVRVDLREAAYAGARRDNFLREIAAEVERIPGIRAVSYSQLGVFSGGESGATIDVQGHTPAGKDDRDCAMDVVGPRYFSTLGIPIRLGREIVESDLGSAAGACVINDAFAKRFYDRRDPIGTRITLVNDDTRTSCQVVGIAGNARTQSLRGDVEPRFFITAREPATSSNSPTFLIRTGSDAPPPLAAVRKTVQGVDAAVPVIDAASIEEQMAPLTAQDRATAQLALVFGSVALALAAIGLYGVLSYGVARRTGEIAIRIALGAQQGRVISMILHETIALVAFGVALGGALAIAASRLIDSRLYGVAPQDPLTLTAATALLLAVALVAAYVPAVRASRVDPMAALRQA